MPAAPPPTYASREAMPVTKDSLQRHLNVRDLRPVASPFAYALADEFFRPATYATLRDEFPSIARRSGTGRNPSSLYWGDAEYERHLERSPAWKEVFHAIQSQAFLDFVIATFGDHWEREGCTLDLAKARYVPWVEDRVDKERQNLRRVDHDPHELWCRLDFSESTAGSYGPLHRDLRRRLISMIVYFDAAGGGLILHRCGIDLRLLRAMGVGRVPRAYSRVRDLVAATARVDARPNRMVVLLNSNRSWHSAATVLPARLPARQVRIAISSSVDVWR